MAIQDELSFARVELQLVWKHPLQHRVQAALFKLFSELAESAEEKNIKLTIVGVQMMWEGLTSNDRDERSGVQCE